MVDQLPKGPPQDALAQLRDIHLPDPIGWWPPAVGWYVVAGLFMLLLYSVIHFSVRYWLNGRSKRRALRILASYQQAYMKSRDSQVASARISELLKRVALVYYPRLQVASLQGQAWINFLNETSHALDFNLIAALLIECPYQPASKQDLLPLFDFAVQWIKQRSGRCLN
jgi:hypothetical protein